MLKSSGGWSIQCISYCTFFSARLKLKVGLDQLAGVPELVKGAGLKLRCVELRGFKSHPLHQSDFSSFLLNYLNSFIGVPWAARMCFSVRTGDCECWWKSEPNQNIEQSKHASKSPFSSLHHPGKYLIGLSTQTQ